MINKRLLSTVSESKKYIAGNVIAQWIGLVCNIVIMFCITGLLGNIIENKVIDKNSLIFTFGFAILALAIRFACALVSTKMSYYSSKWVKLSLREMIYKKLLKLGANYNEKVQTSEVIQVAVEGVDQLESYFGAYVPQFFYAMLAPVTLFVVMSFISWQCALFLLICVPLIPLAIVGVQTWAKKLLSKYWGQYTELGDSFLENIQALTTLKIYKADKFKNDEMNEEAEKFRKITMKVLTMQLNSITIMDLVAYLGAAIAVVIAVLQLNKGVLTAQECLLIILLSADYFIPMRQLGSFFHIAMNGMAASDKIFRLIDTEEPAEDTDTNKVKTTDIVVKNVDFSYNSDRQILKDVSLSFPQNSFIAICGESGSGKSTIASILTSKNKNYIGNIKFGGVELSEISETELMQKITYIGHNSYLFKGTVRDNLLMGKFDATDDELWDAVERVKLAGFLKSENGLDTVITEKGSNLSGGQCQRLALARAILHDSPVFIFDEATSNIDVESENYIMNEIQNLSKTKSIIMISHRLANSVDADKIYVLDDGRICEEGTHEELLQNRQSYYKLWNAQQQLENYTGKEQ